MQKAITILILFILVSCVSYNEFGTYRVNKSRYTLKPNEDNSVYSKIDTNAVYRFAKEEYKNVSGMQIKSFYKFYSNGKIGLFYTAKNDFNKDLLLDSRKAFMGFYSFNGKEIIAQFYNKNWHGQDLETDTLFIHQDTVVNVYSNSKNNSEVKLSYVREKISNDVKIVQPDW